MRRLLILILLASSAGAQATARLEWKGGDPGRNTGIALGPLSDTKPDQLVAPIGLKKGRYGFPLEQAG